MSIQLNVWGPSLTVCLSVCMGCVSLNWLHIGTIKVLKQLSEYALWVCVHEFMTCARCSHVPPCSSRVWTLTPSLNTLTNPPSFVRVYMSEHWKSNLWLPTWTNGCRINKLHCQLIGSKAFWMAFSLRSNQQLKALDETPLTSVRQTARQTGGRTKPEDDGSLHLSALWGIVYSPGSGPACPWLPSKHQLPLQTSNLSHPRPPRHVGMWAIRKDR